MSHFRKLTNDFSDLQSWKNWVEKQPIDKLKQIPSPIIRKLPKEYQYNLLITKFNKIHHKKYKYNFDLEWFINNYKDRFTKIPIICPNHGEFYQSVLNHTQGYGCSVCSGKQKLTFQSFLERAIRIHNNRYTYPFNEKWWNENYKDNKTKIPIICSKHGEFYVKVNKHLIGRGCKICGYESTRQKFIIPYKTFIEKATEIHNNRYIYPFNEKWWDKNYKDRTSTKVPIICPNHGEFYQSVQAHLSGHGCHICKFSNGERIVAEILEKLKIDYICQYSIRINNRRYYIDFYLPECNAFIEFDGVQHFKPIGFFGGENSLLHNVHRDKIKDEFAKNSGIKMIRIPFYMKYEEIELKLTLELNKCTQRKNCLRY